VRVKSSQLSSQLGRKPGFVLRESILRSLIFFPRLARKNHAKAEATSSLRARVLSPNARRNLFYVSCQTVARAKEINVLPSGAKTGAIDRLWRRFCGKCSKHPAVPGDSLKYRLASNLPFSRSSQVSSPVRPSTRLLRRRILARRPDYSQCGTNKRSSSIGFPPQALQEPPISCSDDPLQSSCAPLSIPVCSRTAFLFSTSCATT
jgi:hypothetical protein